MMMRLLLALGSIALLGVPSLQADEKDLLDEIKARQAIEAQRVEREFATQRAAAYRLVRSGTPQAAEATEKLQALLGLIRSDVSLEPKRREVLLVTLQFDLKNVQQIARLRQPNSNGSVVLPAMRAARMDAPRQEETRRGSEARRPTDEARAIIESRSRVLADSRSDRLRAADRFAKVMRTIDDSAVPEAKDYNLPSDWVEISKRRSSAVKMTDKERALMQALATVVDVEFNKNRLEDVLDYFRKSLKIDLAVDRRALEEVTASYDSEVSLKLRGSARTVLKRLLADLNLAYIIKDEALQITSRERASQMTTTRAYYIGDLMPLFDLRYPPVMTQMAMVETVNRIIAMVQQQVDPQSWRSNNPDANGAIVFDPITMSLVVRQTAEVHFLLGGSMGR